MNCHRRHEWNDKDRRTQLDDDGQDGCKNILLGNFTVDTVLSKCRLCTQVCGGIVSRCEANRDSRLIHI